MKYIVMLDERSAVGRAYLAGNNDGVTKTGCPIIDCSSIEHVGAFLACTRKPTNPAKSRQFLLIPNHAVAHVVGYAKEAERPIGFGPA